MLKRISRVALPLVNSRKSAFTTTTITTTKRLTPAYNSTALLTARPHSSALGRRIFSTHSQPTVGSPNEYGSPDHHFEEAVSNSESDGRNFHYAVSGATRFLYASAARLVVVRFVASMAAAADVLALGSLEVPLSSIAQGTTLTVKWRGKPVFIRHRTPAEIESATQTEMSQLKDPQKDEERAKNPEWLVVLGVCTHLGCVPISNAGEYNGWFCPCHGSHYDTSGRIRKGPAPTNLEVPEHKFINESTLLIG